MKSYLSLIPISAKVHRRQNRMTLLCIVFAVFKMCIRGSTYGVYPEEIDGLKRDYEKLWGEVSKVLRELSELVAK